MIRPVTVVVPCYNEEHRLRPELFREFASKNPEVAFLFVNDGSTDSTESLLESQAKAHPEFMSFLSLTRNMGKGEAVRSGLQKAIETGAEVVAYWDADLSTPLEELGGMLGVLENDPGVLGVLGSRVKLLGRSIDRKPVRHYMGRVFATAASMVLRLPVYDTQCGAKVFRATDDLKRVLAQPFNSRWIFDVELLARLRTIWGTTTEEKIPEYPVHQWQDVGGSKIKPKDLLTAAGDLWGIWRRRGRREEEYKGESS